MDLFGRRTDHVSAGYAVRGPEGGMRWVVSFVAEAHRNPMRSGVFMYPRDPASASGPGQPRLPSEASLGTPLVGWAACVASTGWELLQAGQALGMGDDPGATDEG